MSLRGIRAAIGLGLVATLAGMTLTAGPAAAADEKPITKTSSTGEAGTMTEVEAAAADSICINLEYAGTQWGGRFICDYGFDAYSFPNGTLQIFVIGPDYAVYTRWRTGTTLSAWVNLGGQVKRGEYSSPWVTGSGYSPTINVYGNTAGLVLYTRTRSSSTGAWSAWARR